MTWEEEAEALAYFGMRIVFRGERGRDDLRVQARRSMERKARFAEDWQNHQTLRPLRIVGEEHLEALAAAKRGAVIALSHVGPYHRIPLGLSERGIGVTLLLDEENFNVEAPRAAAWLARFTGTSAVPLDYLNVREPTASWRAVQAVKGGRFAVIYLDGNTGVESAGEAASTVVQFHGTPLRVRKGIGTLSGHAGVPVVPVTIERDGDHDVCTIGTPIERMEGEAPSDYAHRVMQRCYDGLATVIERDAAAWEEWYHLPRWYVAGLRSGRSEDMRPPFVTPDLEAIDLIALAHGPTVTSTRSGIALLATPEVLLCLASEETLSVDAVEEKLRGVSSDPGAIVSELLATGFLVAAESR